MKRFSVYAALFTVAVFHAATAGAQASSQHSLPGDTPGLESARPGDERLSTQEQESEKAPPEIELPPLPPLEEEDTLSSVAKVFVRTFRLTGNTVFSSEDLAEITAPYEGREITFEQLQQVRHALTLYYVKSGYINSGAVIPDQAVADGVIEIRIVEGTLKKIDVAGAQKIRDDYIKRRLALGAGPPLNIKDLQYRLQLLQQSPLIKRINAQLEPGLLRGESLLKVRVVEERPYRVWFRFGNNQSPSVGSERGEVYVTHRNVSGRGDVFEGTFGRSRSLTDYYVSYTLPVSARDTTIEIQFRKNDSKVIEAPFERLDINSESETQALTVERPFYRTLSKTFSMALTFERRWSQTYLLGRPFSFTASAEEGRTKVTVVRFKQTWSDRSRVRVFAARSTFNVGIGALGATINDSGEDSRFLSWLGQFQWTRRLGESGSRVIFLTNAQLSNDPLVPLEQFAIGGGSSVRGYRENQFVRDNGLVASLEFLLTVLSYHGGESSLQLAPFIDYGKSWNAERSTPPPDYIAGAGMGLRWSLSRNTHIRLYWGYPLKKVPGQGETLQEQGVHFSISSRLY